jgi:hypothetical protein
MEPESLSSWSQQPPSPYPEPDESNPHSPTLYPSDPSYLRLAFPNGLFPSDIPVKILYYFVISSLRAKCPAHLIHLELIKVSRYTPRRRLGEEEV